MANLTPDPVWEDVYQIEPTDRVLGGAGGVSNLQAQSLANQNLYARKHGGDMPFLPGITYDKGDSVRLINGETVSSTIDNNTTDPNVSMTGWENFKQKARDKNFTSYYDVRTAGIFPNPDLDQTSAILAFIDSVPAKSTVYIPQGVKWTATSNPSAVYTVMKDSVVVLDDSGYESRYSGIPEAERWQASQQRYYKNLIGSAGARNGNTFNVRGSYHPGYVVENDAAVSTGGCRSSIIYRFNAPELYLQDFQFGADYTSLADAHIGAAIYGTGLLGTGDVGQTSSKVMELHGYQSISPGAVVFNSSVVQDATLVLGKRKARVNQGTPETLATYAAAPHVIRIVQPTGHTGTFTKLWYKGSALQHREDINDAGDRTYTPKTSGQGTMTYTNLNELGGHKKRVITGSIGATVSTIYSNGYCSNFGAGGAQNVTLPAPTKGLTFDFGVDAAQNLRIIPNSGANFIGKAADKYMESNTLGSKLRVIALDATTWAFERSGTWVDQA